MGEEAACARGVGSCLGPGSGDEPGCGPSSWLPRLEQVTQGVQSRPRSGPGERRAPRGPSGVASAGAGLASQLPGMRPARAGRGERESQAREAPSTALARPPADLAPCSRPRGDTISAVVGPTGRRVRAAGPGPPSQPTPSALQPHPPGPFCSWAQKWTTPVLSDVLSELTLRVAKLWSRWLSFQKLLGARPLINYRAWMGRVFGKMEGERGRGLQISAFC